MDLETLQNNLIPVIVLATFIGIFLGWLLTYLLMGRGPSKTELTGKLEEVEEEFEAHKAKVDQHFATTSELVNDLTESYVKVYKHLSDGAEQLGGVVDMRNRLTLNESQGSTESEEGSSVIEGALATTVAGGTAGAAGSENVEDPNFTVSDEAVEATLTELEQAVPESAEIADADTFDPEGGVAKNDEAPKDGAHKKD